MTLIKLEFASDRDPMAQLHQELADYLAPMPRCSVPQVERIDRDDGSIALTITDPIAAAAYQRLVLTVQGQQGECKTVDIVTNNAEFVVVWGAVQWAIGESGWWIVTVERGW